MEALLSVEQLDQAIPCVEAALDAAENSGDLHAAEELARLVAFSLEVAAGDSEGEQADGGLHVRVDAAYARCVELAESHDQMHPHCAQLRGSDQQLVTWDTLTDS